MTLFRTVTPLPDENLAGLVARAAGINIYTHAHDVLKLAELGHVKPQAIATKGAGQLALLAHVLGTTTEYLEPLFHQARSVSTIDFFGTNLRSIYRETARRRISPRALKDKTYVRAIWSVRPITFDPVTKEMLIDSCPVCSKPLGFAKTWGVEYCEHCVDLDEYGMIGAFTDLRDFPQSIAQVADVEALDFATALIDPCGDTDATSLHDDLAGLSRGDLFELVVAIGTAVQLNQTDEHLKSENSSRAGVTNLAPETLAAAGRAVLNWPKGFNELCASAHDASARRPGDWGAFKEFGALANLQRDPFLASSAKQAVKGAMDRLLADRQPGGAVPRKTTRALPVGEYIGTRQLLRLAPIGSKITTKLGQHPEMFTYRVSNDAMSPIHFDTWQAASVIDHYLDLVSETTLGVIFGLPPDAVRDLAASSISRQCGGTWDIAVDLAGGGDYYSKQSADELVDILTQGIAFKKPPKGYIPFLEAMLMFPSGRRPWLPMMEAVMFQRVDAVFRKNVPRMPKVKNLFGSLSVRGVEAQRDDILWRHSMAKHHDIDRVSGVAANLMLGIYNHKVFMACDEAKLIDVKDGTASYANILDFAAEYIFANEASVRSRNGPRALGAWMAARDIRPAYSFPVNGGDVYLREQVEPHLMMKV